MGTIEQYDWRNISYQQALEFERIWHEAISDDPLRLTLFPRTYQFAPSRLPELSDYDELIKRAKLFKLVAECDARQFQIRIRSEPRVRVFLLKNEKGQYTSTALWTLPKYMKQSHLPLLYRLKTWFMARWYAIRNWWAMLGQPGYPTSVRRILDEGRKQLKVVEDKPERVEELQRLSPKELEETTYPSDYTYYLLLFSTRRSAHGHGYGKRLLEESLEALRPYIPPPHFAGPPKSTLHASPPARGFYEKHGYALGALHEITLPNGTAFPHTYYYRNLEPF